MTLQQIRKFTESYFNIEDLSIKSRKKEIVFARSLAFYISQRHDENASLIKIGNEIASQDHSTVIYALRTVSRYLTEKTLKGNIMYEKEFRIISKFLLKFNEFCNKQTEFDITEIQFYKVMNELRNENLVYLNKKLYDILIQISKTINVHRQQRIT